MTLLEASRAGQGRRDLRRLRCRPRRRCRAGPAAAAPAEEEKTEFDVVLEGFGDNKIQVIKVVRELTSLGLKEAKEVVENAPKAVLEGVKKEDADAAKESSRPPALPVSLK